MAVSRLVYGLGVQTNVPILGLERLAPSERIDVRVVMGELPNSVENLPEGDVKEFYVRQGVGSNGEAQLRVSRILGGKFFRFAYADKTTFIVDAAGSQVWGAWSSNDTVEDAATYLLGPILGFLLRLRGITCLHASAIAIGSHAMAIVGPSGAGKSSTAAAFAQLGYPILSDDIVALAEVGSRFAVQPAYPRVRLWPQSVQSMFGAADALPQIAPSWNKRFLDLDGSEYRFQSEPLRLAAIYCLGERSQVSGAPSIDAMDSRSALMALVTDSYATRLLDAEMRAHEFKTLARVVNSVPSRRVTATQEIARISKLCEFMLQDFEQVLSGNSLVDVP